MHTRAANTEESRSELPTLADAVSALVVGVAAALLALVAAGAL